MKVGLRKEGNRYRFRDTYFWAEKGSVCLENAEDGRFKALSAETALERAAAMKGEIDHIWRVDERIEYEQAVEALEKVAREALRQGDCTRDEVSSWYSRHKPLANRYTLITDTPWVRKEGDILVVDDR